MDLDFLNSSPETQMDWFPTDYHNDQIPQPQVFESNPPPLPVQFSETVANKPMASVREMREMVFCMAALQPVHIDPESIKPPKRKNVKISKDPQSVAARLRREKISERIRILQRLVPGGTKMDTASMLDEAVEYMKFLKNQVQSMERATFAGSSSGTNVMQTGLMMSTDDSAGRVYQDKMIRKRIIF